MKLPARLASVPEKIYILIFSGVFLVAAFSAYFTRQDTVALEGRIAAKQKDLAEVLRLRDVYETKKRDLERHAVKKPGSQESLSLALVEGMVTKSFVGGSLAALQPSKGKGEKGGKESAVEVKVTGAALGEVVTFVKEAENAGLRVERLRLSLPAAKPTALDLQATLAERGSHG